MRLIVLLPMLFVLACQKTPDDRHSGAAPAANAPTNAIFVYRHDVGGWEGPAMNLDGAFVVQDGCLVFETDGSRLSPLLPEGTTLAQAADGAFRIEVRRGASRDNIPLGTRFAMTGDVVNESAAAALSSQILPDKCPQQIFRTAGARR